MSVSDEISASPFASPMWRGLMEWAKNHSTLACRHMQQEAVRPRAIAILSKDHLPELTIEEFNEHVWRFGKAVDAQGKEWKWQQVEALGPDELREALDSGKLTITGNRSVGQATNGWEVSLGKGKGPEIVDLLRRTVEELLYEGDDRLGALEHTMKASNGFGRNIGTLLLCILWPSEYGLWNEKSIAGVKKLAWLLGTESEWEESYDRYADFNALLLAISAASEGAFADLLGLDSFLYLLSELGAPGHWKVALGLDKPEVRSVLIERCGAQGFAAIGWDRDLPVRPSDANTVWFDKIQPGDYVVMHIPGKIGGVGRCTRPAYDLDLADVGDDVDAYYFRRIGVDWLLGERSYGDALPGAKMRRTVIDLDEKPYWGLAQLYSEDARYQAVLNPPEEYHTGQTWIFQCNPKTWDVLTVLDRDMPFDDDWTVNQYRGQPQVGDTAYIWRAGDDAGIYAVARIASEEHAVPGDAIGENKVDITYQRRVDPPLLKARLLGNSLTAGLSVIRNPQGSNFKVTQEQAQAIGAMLDGVQVPVHPPLPRSYSLEQMSDETSMPLGLLQRWVRAIERKGQAILYGPPGTGKTYLAERLARYLVGDGDGFSELVQFHPTYAYEDFMQGIRPRTMGEAGLEYSMEAGRFLSFCAKADSRKSRCVLIIDEINRANLARVFGELMYLLEYRGATHSIPLAGGEEHFSIPDNVRIIGTMNTADRSIALVDHALRRRFAFLALHPQYEVLERFHAGTGFPVEALIQVLRAANADIADGHYEIGLSFFLRKDLADHIEDIWRMEIEPYLEEYFIDRPQKAEGLCWDHIHGKLGL